MLIVKKGPTQVPQEPVGSCHSGLRGSNLYMLNLIMLDAFHMSVKTYFTTGCHLSALHGFQITTWILLKVLIDNGFLAYA